MPVFITSPQAILTTICFATTYTDTTGPLWSLPMKNILSFGSLANSALGQETGVDASSAQTMLSRFRLAVQGLQIPIANAALISNADADEILTANAMIISVLQSLATTRLTLDPVAVASYLNVINNSLYRDNLFILNRLGILSCDRQNLLNSMDTKVSSQVFAMQQVSWLESYLTSTITWKTIPSVDCPGMCVTSTVAATGTTETATTATSDTASTTSSDIISTQNINGSAQRCRVSPSSSTSNTVTSIPP